MDYMAVSRALDRQLKAGILPKPEQTRKLHHAMLAALAETCIDWGQTQTAADILAFLLRQDPIDPGAFETAADRFAELESAICPRVIHDARDFAAGMDLRTMLEYLLEVAPRARN